MPTGEVGKKIDFCKDKLEYKDGKITKTPKPLECVNLFINGKKDWY